MMKQLLVLSICGLSVFLLGSCRSSAGNKSGVEVIIDGDGQFPAFLVGRWKADKGGWEIVFEPDGTISSAVVSLGRAKMRPGQVTAAQMKMGGKGLFDTKKYPNYKLPFNPDDNPRESLIFQKVTKSK